MIDRLTRRWLLRLWLHFASHPARGWVHTLLSDGSILSALWP